MEDFAPQEGEIIHGRTHSAFLAAHYEDLWYFIRDHKFDNPLLKLPGGQAKWYPWPYGANRIPEGRTWKETPKGVFILEKPILTAAREARSEAGFLDLPIEEIEIVKCFPRHHKNGEEADDYLYLLRADYAALEREPDLDADEYIEVEFLHESEIVEKWSEIHAKYREYLTLLPLGNGADVQMMYDLDVWERSRRRARRQFQR